MTFITSYYKHFTQLCFIIFKLAAYSMEYVSKIYEKWASYPIVMESQAGALNTIWLKFEACTLPSSVTMMSCYLWSWKAALLGVRLSRLKGDPRAWSREEKNLWWRRLTGKARKSMLNALSADPKCSWHWEFYPLLRNRGNDASVWALASFSPYTLERPRRKKFPSDSNDSLIWIVFAVMISNIYFVVPLFPDLFYVLSKH